MEVNNNIYHIPGNTVQTGNKPPTMQGVKFPDIPQNPAKPAQAEQAKDINYADFEKYSAALKANQTPAQNGLSAAYDKTGKGVNSFQNLIKDSEGGNNDDLSSFISLII